MLRIFAAKSFGKILYFLYLNARGLSIRVIIMRRTWIILLSIIVDNNIARSRRPDTHITFVENVNENKRYLFPGFGLWG